MVSGTRRDAPVGGKRWSANSVAVALLVAIALTGCVGGQPTGVSSVPLLGPSSLGPAVLNPSTSNPTSSPADSSDCPTPKPAHYAVQSAAAPPGLSSPALLHDQESASWGPPRQQFESPCGADFATLNSSDTPASDERYFVFARDITSNAPPSTDVLLVAGHTYAVDVWFANDVLPNAGILARGVRASVTLPRYVAGSGLIRSTVSSTNAVPHAVWASMSVHTADETSEMELVADQGSPTLVVGGAAGGVGIPWGELTSDAGSLVGCDRRDGELSGERKCRGDVEFRFTAEAPGISVETRLLGGVGESFETRSGGTPLINTRITNRTQSPMGDIALEVRVPTGITIDVTSLQFRNASSTGDQTPWIPATPADFTQVDQRLRLSLSKTAAVPPGDSIDISFRIAVGAAVAPCGGSWQRIDTWAEHDGVYVKSELIANVDSGC